MKRAINGQFDKALVFVSDKHIYPCTKIKLNILFSVDPVGRAV